MEKSLCNLLVLSRVLEHHWSAPSHSRALRLSMQGNMMIFRPWQTCMGVGLVSLPPKQDLSNEKMFSSNAS